jgi:hypothetical protein
MSATLMQIISCDGPNCDKTIAIELTNNGQPTPQSQEILAATDWVKGLRVVQTGDKRSFNYCSDTCLVEHAGTGVLNPPEEKKIISIDQGKHALALAQAKKHAEAARQSDQALKSGQLIKIQE